MVKIKNFIYKLFKNNSGIQAVNYVIFLFAYIIFHKPIESFISKTFVEYLFSEVDSNIANDIVYIVLLLFICRFYYVRRKNYVASENVTLSIILITLIYFYYRFISSVWIFTPVRFVSFISYSDLIFIIAIGNVNLWLKNKKEINLPENGGEAFLDDESLGKIKADELGYAGYAGKLAEKIKASNFDKSFAIGVNGKWGLGNDSLIAVDFNPWNSHTPDAIIKDFFETIQEVIRPYHSSLARLLVLYANKLVSINENTITKTIQGSVNAFTGNESLNSIFSDINAALKKIQIKIVIFIDDLDRLDKEEIVEVIRLIRNTANFHNTFFVVAYDRNYIVQALQSHNSYNHEQFLEKIFQHLILFAMQEYSSNHIFLAFYCNIQSPINQAY